MYKDSVNLSAMIHKKYKTKPKTKQKASRWIRQLTPKWKKVLT